MTLQDVLVILLLPAAWLWANAWVFALSLVMP